MNQPPIILLAFANDLGTPTAYLKQLSKEVKALELILREAEQKGLCKMVLIENATLERILAVFQKPAFQNRIAIFHFAGHANQYSILLEDEFRKQHPIFMKGFAAYLSTQKQLKLVFLNGCATREQADFLHQANIPVVIATQRLVKDDVAVEIATWFYTALGLGYDLNTAWLQVTALQESLRKNIESTTIRGIAHKEQQNKQIDWLWLPNIHHKEVGKWNLPDAIYQPLFHLPKLPDTPLPNTPFIGLRPYETTEATIFWGRDYQIRDFYQLITGEQSPKVCLLYGATGIGKTSFLQAGVLSRLQLKFPVQFLKIEEGVFQIEELENKLSILINKSATFSRTFLVIDGLTDILPILVEKIQMICTATNNNIYFILCVRTCNRKNWQTYFRNSSSFFLPPLDADGIAHIFTQLKEKAIIGKELELRLSRLLLIDDTATSTPILQLILQQLWQVGKAKNNSRPELTWKAYEMLLKTNFWQKILLKQLEKVDMSAFNSGLLLNILRDIEQLKNPTESILPYHHLKKPLKEYLHSLKKYRLITEPATDDDLATITIKLSHQLLKDPLIELLNESKRPGQEALSVLHFTKPEHWEESQITLINSNLNISIPYIEGQKELVQKQKRLLQKQKNRQLLWSITQVVIVTLILLFGIFLNNPYLLLLVVLVVVLYR